MQTELLPIDGGRTGKWKTQKYTTVYKTGSKVEIAMILGAGRLSCGPVRYARTSPTEGYLIRTVPIIPLTTG